MEKTDKTVILEFVRYNNWANMVMLSALEKLSAEELDATAVGTYGNIRETMYHIIRGEATYLFRLNGMEMPMRWDDKPDMATVREYATRVGAEMLKVVAEMEPYDMAHDEWEGAVVQYPAINVWIELINHGVEHRTNITTIMENLKLTPPQVDGWGFMEASYKDRAKEASSG